MQRSSESTDWRLVIDVEDGKRQETEEIQTSDIDLSTSLQLPAHNKRVEIDPIHAQNSTLN